MRCYFCHKQVKGELPLCNNIKCVEQYAFKMRVTYSKKTVKEYLWFHNFALNQAIQECDGYFSKYGRS